MITIEIENKFPSKALTMKEVKKERPRKFSLTNLKGKICFWFHYKHRNLINSINKVKKLFRRNVYYRIR